MRLSHALVALVGTSAALVTAAPIRRFETSGIDSGEVPIANGDLKPLEKHVDLAKQRPKPLFRSLTERRLRKRAEKKKFAKLELVGFDHATSMDIEGGTIFDGAGEPGRTKPSSMITSRGTISVDGGKLDAVDLDNGSDHKSGKKVKKPKKKAQKEKSRRKGNEGGEDSGTGSDDDPETDNASENEHGTDNDEA